MFDKIEPKHPMRGTQIIAYNHQLIKVTSNRIHNIQQNVPRIEDKEHGDLVSCQLQRLIYNQSHTHCGHFLFRRVDDAKV